MKILSGQVVDGTKRGAELLQAQHQYDHAGKDNQSHHQNSQAGIGFTPAPGFVHCVCCH